MSKQINDARFRHAVVDEAPPSEGFGTEPFNFFDVQAPDYEVYFSMFDASEGGNGIDVTVTIQYKFLGSVWVDYNTYTTQTDNAFTSGGGGRLWRAIVKNGDYNSGTVRFGFNW